MCPQLLLSLNHSSPLLLLFTLLSQTRPLPWGIVCTKITLPKGDISRVIAFLVSDDLKPISTSAHSHSEKSQVMICKWLVDCAKGGHWVLLIALTLPVTHQNINHNYDKITQLIVSEE